MGQSQPHGPESQTCDPVDGRPNRSSAAGKRADLRELQRRSRRTDRFATPDQGPPGRPVHPRGHGRERLDPPRRGEETDFSVLSPNRRVAVAVRYTRRGAGSVRAGTRGDGQRHRPGRQVRRPDELADDQMSVEVPGGFRFAQEHGRQCPSGLLWSTADGDSSGAPSCCSTSASASTGSPHRSTGRAPVAATGSTRAGAPSTRWRH